MRSALVVTDSRIWNAETEYAAAVASAEAGMGASVTLVAPAESVVASRKPVGVEFVPLPGASPSKSPADFVAGVREIARLTRRDGHDVVHSSRPTAHIMAALATGSTVPLIHLRGSAAAPSGTTGNRFLYRRATSAVVASSARVKRWVEETLGVPSGRVHRLLLPVGPEWFERARVSADFAREFDVPEGAPVILNVARLAPIKGHDVLLDATARILSAVPDAVLMLVGEAWSGQPEGLRARARELGIERSVRFTGRRDDVRALIASAAVCVTSSIGSEENSRAVGEYMAAGRPVVATEVGVIPELVVEGETGFLVPPRDAHGLSDAVLRVLTDRSLAERMGAAGRKSATSRFSHEAFVGGLDGVLSGAGVRR